MLKVNVTGNIHTDQRIIGFLNAAHTCLIKNGLAVNTVKSPLISIDDIEKGNVITNCKSSEVNITEPFVKEIANFSYLPKGESDPHQVPIQFGGVIYLDEEKGELLYLGPTMHSDTSEDYMFHIFYVKKI